MNSDTLISLKNVGCSYYIRKSRFRSGRYDALKDVTLDIKYGETLGLVGKKWSRQKHIASDYQPDINAQQRYCFL